MPMKGGLSSPVLPRPLLCTWNTSAPLRMVFSLQMLLCAHISHTHMRRTVFLCTGFETNLNTTHVLRCLPLISLCLFFRVTNATCPSSSRKKENMDLEVDYHGNSKSAKPFRSALPVTGLKESAKERSDINSVHCK